MTTEHALGGLKVCTGCRRLMHGRPKDEYEARRVLVEYLREELRTNA
jgi:hypothetical protein